MGQAIGDILAPAVGVAISPMPIAMVILMLLTPKARATGTAFMIGWILGIVLIVGIVLVVADPAKLADKQGDPSTASSIIHLLLGLVLLLLAVKQWQGRPKDGVEPVMPKWMKSIDKVTPVVALGIGALMSGINVKNLILNIAAGTTIAQADLSIGGQTVVALIYTLLATVSVGGVVVWYLVAGKQADAKLNLLKDWLARNNAVVMSVLFLVLGSSQLGTGIGGLLS